uniref:Uncharacterized protein LOC102806485 n=1 Tax=Saccoglossus kowalevskii TaxID=10224 RepID=A0ABM0M918_SACKO|nr:PREDICTED: uncharacterized protein LOC102806485 [Saccoglossus kowalevskii]
MAKVHNFRHTQKWPILGDSHVTTKQESCPSLSIYGIVWPETLGGNLAEIRCPVSIDGDTAKRSCDDGNTSWSEPDMTDCYTTNEIAELYFEVESLTIDVADGLVVAYELLLNSSSTIDDLNSAADVTIMTALLIASSQIATRDMEYIENGTLLDIYIQTYMNSTSGLLEHEESFQTLSTFKSASSILSQFLWNTEKLGRYYGDHLLTNGVEGNTVHVCNNILIETNVLMDEQFLGWSFTPDWPSDVLDDANNDKRQVDNVFIPSSVITGVMDLAVSGVLKDVKKMNRYLGLTSQFVSAGT